MYNILEKIHEYIHTKRNDNEMNTRTGNNIHYTYNAHYLLCCSFVGVV
jgi:hypothetical protein